MWRSGAVAIINLEDVIFLLMWLAAWSCSVFDTGSEWLLRACGQTDDCQPLSQSVVFSVRMVRQDGNCLDTKHCSGN